LTVGKDYLENLIIDEIISELSKPQVLGSKSKRKTQTAIWRFEFFVLS